VFSPSSPVTGAAVTGLTSPTYTLTSDTPVNSNSKAYAVTALGGTQTGVDVHAASKPFRLYASRPANIRSAPLPNPVTGAIPTSPRNVYVIGVDKGAVPVSGQASQIARIRAEFSIPAGTDVNEPEELLAMVSLFAGAVWAQADGIAQLCKNAVL
jgi:hypothetical protein